MKDCKCEGFCICLPENKNGDIYYSATPIEPSLNPTMIKQIHDIVRDVISDVIDASEREHLIVLRDSEKNNYKLGFKDGFILGNKIDSEMDSNYE